MRASKLTLIIAGISALAALTGCAPKELPPTTRPALQASDVQLLVKPPAEFENHGIIFSQEVRNPPQDWRADVWIDQLKAEAAAKGCNGLLIVPTDEMKEYEQGKDDRYVYVGGYYGKQFFTFPVTSTKPRKLIGRAVYIVRP